MTQGDSEDIAGKEEAWLQWLQGQCNSVIATCSLPADRPATADEMKRFMDGLLQVEQACTTADQAAAALLAQGRPVLAERLKAVRADVAGARKTFQQPASTQPGPLAVRMLELKAEEAEVQSFSTAAAMLIQTEPARAIPQLEEAIHRGEEVFNELKELLQKMPWGAGELPMLEADRTTARALLRSMQGAASAALHQFDQAIVYFDQALRELPRDHQFRVEIEEKLADVELQRLTKRGAV
jgi:hypothetical protein